MRGAGRGAGGARSGTRDAGGVVVRVLGPGEAAVLDRVAPDVFDNDVDARWAAEFFADPRHHLAVAIDGDTVVGMASAVHYVHPDKAPELWINEVGVAPSHQRQGIGRELLEAVFALGRELGCREAWVLTDDGNAAARGLYAAVGGEETRALMVSFPLATTPRSGGPLRIVEADGPGRPDQAEERSQ